MTTPRQMVDAHHHVPVGADRRHPAPPPLVRRPDRHTGMDRNTGENLHLVAVEYESELNGRKIGGLSLGPRIHRGQQGGPGEPRTARDPRESPQLFPQGIRCQRSRPKGRENPGILHGRQTRNLSADLPRPQNGRKPWTDDRLHHGIRSKITIRPRHRPPKAAFRHVGGHLFFFRSGPARKKAKKVPPFYKSFIFACYIDSETTKRGGHT